MNFTFMCGRFQLSVKGKEISERFNVEVHDEIHRPDTGAAQSLMRYNCAPMQWLPIISNAAPQLLTPARWGLVPFWAKDATKAAKMINARAETVLQKSAFKNAFLNRRCLVPSNGFYEWKKTSEKPAYRFFLKDGGLFAMAGLWDQWKDNQGNVIQTFTILTTNANALMQDIHERMPVILSSKDENKWLNSNNTDELQSLLKPYQSEEMDCYRVSSLVNSVANDNPQIVQPYKPTPDLFNQMEW